MIEITANSYSGRYGADSDMGDIIHVQIKVGPTSSKTKNKEIIFLTDVSGSMESSMKEIKSSTLAFRDSLVEKTPKEMEQLSPIDRDMMFRNKIKTRFITFSNEAKEVWSSSSHNNQNNLFENVVLGLQSQALTNMGDALNMAFDKLDRKSFGWIIAMTDGESNKGPCRTRESFQQLVTSNKPLNSKIVTLGYGDKFDPEVLNVVGTFAYVENSEFIPIVLGNLAEEILTSVGFNCVVDLPNSNMITELTEDTIIFPEGEKNTTGKIIVGDRVVGPLCGNKTYDIVFLPHGNIRSKDQLELYDRIDVRYTDIQTGEEVIRSVKVNHTRKEPNDRIRGLYFESEKKRLIYSLYKAMQLNTKSLGTVIKQIEKIIQTWPDNISVRSHTAETHTTETDGNHKEELLKLIRVAKRQDPNKVTHNASSFLNRAVGSGYTQCDGVNGYATHALTSTRYYLESPLINNGNNSY